MLLSPQSYARKVGTKWGLRKGTPTDKSWWAALARSALHHITPQGQMNFSDKPRRAALCGFGKMHEALAASRWPFLRSWTRNMLALVYLPVQGFGYFSLAQIIKVGCSREASKGGEYRKANNYNQRCSDVTTMRSHRTAYPVRCHGNLHLRAHPSPHR